MLYKYSHTHVSLYALDQSSQHLADVHTIAWAPHLGKSYHLLATASKDKTFRLWKLVPKAQTTTANAQQEGVALLVGNYLVKLVAVHDEHHAEVWRAEWNSTGTILATTGDDGVVKLWKANPQLQATMNDTASLTPWQCIQDVK